MKCGACQFWKKANDPMTIGECRRNAPKPLGWVTGNDDEETRPLVVAAWPVTTQDDFCGEFVSVFDLGKKSWGR